VSAPPVLAVSGLDRRYGDLEALRELELTVGEGECAGVAAFGITAAAATALLTAARRGTRED
jgi:ABC-type branched-subunit amino acid transport system ATPase component